MPKGEQATYREFFERHGFDGKKAAKLTDAGLSVPHAIIDPKYIPDKLVSDLYALGIAPSKVELGPGHFHFQGKRLGTLRAAFERFGNRSAAVRLSPTQVAQLKKFNIPLASRVKIELPGVQHPIFIFRSERKLPANFTAALENLFTELGFDAAVDKYSRNQAQVLSLKPKPREAFFAVIPTLGGHDFEKAIMAINRALGMK